MPKKKKCTFKKGITAHSVDVVAQRCVVGSSVAMRDIASSRLPKAAEGTRRGFLPQTQAA
jgi:hypothetical protein